MPPDELPFETAQTRVQRIESTLVRAALIASLPLGCLVAVCLYRYGWANLALDEALNKSGWMSLKYGVVPIAFIGIAVALYASSRWWTADKHVPGWIQCVLVIGLLGAVNAAVALPVVQQAVWLGVRARVQPGFDDFFMGEVASLRLAHLAPFRGDVPTLKCVGTSQVIRGIDFPLLQSMLPAWQVERRAVAGMVPLKALTAAAYLDIQAGDTLMLYVSGFDLARTDLLDAGWMRSFASQRGVTDLLSIIPDEECSAQWKEVVDISLAATLPLWSCRDGLSRLISHTTGPHHLVKTEAKEADIIEAQQAAYQSGDAAELHMGIQLAALKKLVEQANQAGATTVIFEGQVNPMLESDSTRAQNEVAHQRVQELAHGLGVRYVALADQVKINGGQWSDGTHFDASGRDAFTRYLAQYFAGEVRP